MKEEKKKIQMVDIEIIKTLNIQKGLFNYETKNRTSQRVLLKEGAIIGEKFQELNIQPLETDVFETEFEAHFEIQKKGKKFIFKHMFSNSELKNDDIEKYFIVRSLKKKDGFNPRGMILETGNVLKLGEVKLMITEMNIFKNPFSRGDGLELKTLKNIEEDNKKNIQNMIIDVTEQVETVRNLRKEKPEEELACKYCLLEDITENEMDNLLIYPCKCAGGMKYVHVYCLKNWLKTKIPSNSVTTTVEYKWEKLCCEVCKSKWPMKILYQGNAIDLIEINRPEHPYIIFEKCPSEKESEVNSLFLILGQEEVPTRIGRNAYMDIIINNDTLSRNHCSFEFKNNEFIIKDNMSKFGSFIKVNKDFELEESKIGVQVNNTIYILSVVEIDESEIQQEDIENKF
jgi:hypothetical protein